MTAKRRPPSPQPRRRQVAGIRRPQSPSPRPRQAEPSDALGASEEDTSTVDTSSAAAVDDAPAKADASHEQATTSADEDESAEPGPAAEDDAEKQAKPKPRRKARAKGISKPAATAPADEPKKSERAPRKTSAGTKTAVTAVIGVLLAVVAVVFGILWGNVKSEMANRSMSDPIETSQVKGQIQDEVQKVFSYQWNKLDAHTKDVNGILTGDKVRKQYDLVFPDVKQKAPKEKLTVTTQVSYSSVLNLTDDSASLLVYIEQSSWRGSDSSKKASGGGLMRVDAKLVDGKWRIAGFDTYKPLKPSPSAGSQTPNGSATPAPKKSSSHKPAPTTTKKHK